MSEATSPTAADSGRALLADILDAIRALRLLPHPALSTEELQELARTTENAARSLYALQIVQTDEIDQRGLAAATSCPSTAVLLRQLLRISAHEAHSRARAARAVHPQQLPSGGLTPALLPVLGAALDAGQLDPSHVGTVVKTMQHLPPALDEDVRIDAEQQLVDYALDLDADQFRKVAAHLAEVLDPDGLLETRDVTSRVEFHIGNRSAATGLTRISGRLDDLSVEALKVAIDGLAAPIPQADSIRDPRSAATRRAHALIEVIRRAISYSDLPAHGGRRPQITVTMNWDLMTGRLGTAVTGNGCTLTPAAARQLLCDADITPAVLGCDGQVLDLGRSTRTFTHAVRSAITLRDKGCAWPGCDRPPTRTDVHHVRFWKRDLGPTDYGNGCLLCAYHHTEIHKEQWQARMTPDGFPEFIPPAWIDPERRPRRNTVHALAPGADPP